MVPATVLAASGPRGGIVFRPRSRYQSIEAAAAAGPQASMATGAAPGAAITQNASPPMPVMCG